MEKTFTVGAPVQDVWAFMTDIEKVSTCIPGAEYAENLGDDKHAVMMTVKVGPIKTSYRGEATIRKMDADAHTIEIEGKGTDTKGKGGATMEMVGTLTSTADGGTEVSGDSTVTIQGMLAQFGSRMIEDVSNQLFEQFTVSLRGKLGGDAEADDTGTAEALQCLISPSRPQDPADERLGHGFPSEKVPSPVL